MLSRQGSRSRRAPFLATLPAATLSPLLWSDEQLSLIKGSPVQAEARTRRAALEAEWAAIAESVAADLSLYPPGNERSRVVNGAMQDSTWPRLMVSARAPPSSNPAVLPRWLRVNAGACRPRADAFSEQEFLRAMSVVLASAVYLPAASCFALVPLISGVRRSGRSKAAALDYDADRESVTVTAAAEYRCRRMQSRLPTPVPAVQWGQCAMLLKAKSVSACPPV